jgi:hypothetical protein
MKKHGRVARPCRFGILNFYPAPPALPVLERPEGIALYRINTLDQISIEFSAFRA